MSDYPHSYLTPAIKIAQYLKAGCHVTILLADIVGLRQTSSGSRRLDTAALMWHFLQHGFLDNLKAPIELVEQRSKYYEHVIRALLEAVGVPTDQLKFVLGSSYQKTPECE